MERLVESIKEQFYLGRIVGLEKEVAEFCQQVAKRLVKHGDAIFRFLFDPAVPLTNNAAERTVRAAVIDRRITQDGRSLW